MGKKSKRHLKQGVTGPSLRVPAPVSSNSVSGDQSNGFCNQDSIGEGRPYLSCGDVSLQRAPVSGDLAGFDTQSLAYLRNDEGKIEDMQLHSSNQSIPSEEQLMKRSHELLVRDGMHQHRQYSLSLFTWPTPTRCGPSILYSSGG
jgi:hypothetical protein